VLIEGARTNVVLWSADFSNAAWAYTTATPTHGIADPAGGTTATTLTATSANGQILQGIGGSAGTGTTYSATLWVRRRTGSGAVSLFNPNAGGLTAITPTSSWQRFSAIGAGAAATNFVGIRLATSGDAVDIAFSQLEAATFPSSVIVTTTASATRAADVLTYTAGVSYPLTLWAEFERAVDTGSNEFIATLSATDAFTNTADLSIDSSDRMNTSVYSGGAGQAFANVAGALAINTVYKGAGRVDTNSVRTARGGTLGTEDTVATLPAASPVKLSVGAYWSGLGAGFGYVRRLAVINSAQNDAALQSMTS
jgi:hypothetical protein